MAGIGRGGVVAEGGELGGENQHKENSRELATTGHRNKKEVENTK